MHTLELALIIFFGAEQPSSGSFVAHEVEAESIDNIDDLLCSFVECLLLFFGGWVGANIWMVKRLLVRLAS